MHVVSSFFDFQKKYASISIVAVGLSQCGTCTPKLSISMIVPNTNTEYIAPFFKYLYFLTASMLLIVSCLTTIAPTPFPNRISGMLSVNANAPSTPSIENVPSITSR